MKLFSLLILVLLSSCGPTWHLQQAKKHIKKAEQKGANIVADTTYKKIKFEIDGPKTSFSLGPTVLQRKDGVVNRYVLKDTIIYKDRIKTEIRDNTVYVECPDQEKEVEVPVAVDTTIKAGYTKWQLISNAIGAGLFMFVVGFLLSKVVKIPFLG
jgi:hypothetical protein